MYIYDCTVVCEPVIVQLISYRAVLIISIVVITHRLVVHTLTYPIVFTALPMSEAKRAINYPLSDKLDWCLIKIGAIITFNFFLKVLQLYSY